MIDIIALHKPTIRNYYIAASSEEALSFLTAHHGHAQVVAGGTLLLPQIQRGESYACKLVDISRVGSMRTVEQENGHLLMGGAYTFSAMLANELLRERQPLLYEAAQLVGTPKVRRLGTIGGNVASATGSAEGLLAMVALSAEAEIANLTGSQWLPVDRLCVRCGVSRLDSMAEILTRLRFRPIAPNQGAAMARINSTGAHERSPLALALILSLDERGETLTDSRLALGTRDGIPQRAEPVEQELIGLTIADARVGFVEATKAWLSEHQPVNAKNASLEALLSQSFAHAFEMARQRLAAHAPQA